MKQKTTARKLCSKTEFLKITRNPELNELQKLERASGIELCLLAGGEPSYKTLKIFEGICREELAKAAK